MVDYQAAITLVTTQGDEMQRFRLAYSLGEQQDPRPIIQILEKLQLPEGGFPYQDQVKNPYSLSSTSAKLKIMAELNLGKTPLCERSLKFLGSVQSDEGFWDENPQLLSLKPPFWAQPGELNTQLWITAALADCLTRLGQGGTFRVKKATDFLLQHRKDNGAFQGFRHTTWLAVAVLAPQQGVHSRIIREALNALSAFGDWEATDLSWALDCLFWAGISDDVNIVSRLLAQLEAMQRPMGHWKSLDHPDDVISQTLDSLVTLKQYGRF